MGFIETAKRKNIMIDSTTPTNLTEHQLHTVIGSFLAVLVQLSDTEKLRKTVKWWADNDEAWNQLAALRQLLAPEDMELPASEPDA